MYKVFVNDSPIILTDDKKISTGFEFASYENVSILELVDKLEKGYLEGVCLYCDDLERCWNIFKENFNIQEAAGGKVYNNNDEVLFIKRFQKWDLPKGKLEEGESIEECAIREVEEECGVTGLKIEEKLQTTFHIFNRKEAQILKVTYWYLMSIYYNGKLVPQIEEGIEEVVFRGGIELQNALKNTYANIKLLF